MQLPEFIFHGRVLAAGLLFTKTTANVAQLIIQHWQSGDRLYTFSDCYIVLFSQQQFIVCQLSKGYPLVRFDNGYVTGHWLNQPSQLATNQVLHLLQGEAVSYQLATHNEMSPADWLIIDDYQLVEVSALASPPVIPQVIDNSVGKETREVFGKEQFADDKKQQQLLEAFKRANTTNADYSKPGLFNTAWQGAKALFNKSHAQGSPNQPAPHHKSWKERFAEQLLISKASSLIGRQQAKYLREMMEMFDKGDFDSALKRAISLGSNNPNSAAPPSSPAGFLSGREDLSFTSTSSNSTAVYLEQALEDHLKKMYERSFRQLDQAGRYQEAAFIMAELLNKNDETIRYLEEKLLYQLAAELAEARQMPTARVIRQWLLAGNKERALWLAMATNNYEEPISLLAKTHPNLADQLRRYAAEQYAKAGDYVRAIDMIWPLKDQASDILTTLVEQALSLETGDTAIMRVKALVLQLANEQAHLEALQQLFFTPTPHQVSIRLAAINELVKVKQTTPALQWAAKMAIRSYLHDIAEGNCAYEKALLNRLGQLAADPCLSHEIRKLQLGKNHPLLSNNTKKSRFQLPSTYRAPVIQDVALFEDGRLLVAQGEAGLQLIDHTGKRRQFYSQPAHKLIPSDLGTKALVLCQREDFITLYEFELASLKLISLGDFVVDRFADSYDGSLWFCSHKDAVFCLAIHGNKSKTHWQVNDLPGQVTHIQRNTTEVNLLLDTDHCVHYWRYRFPALSLKWRDPINKLTLEKAQTFCVSADGNHVYLAMLQENRQGQLFARRYDNHSAAEPVDCDGQVNELTATAAWLMVNNHNKNSYGFELRSINQSAISPANLEVKSEAPTTGKIFNQQLVVFNTAGDVILFNLNNRKPYSQFTIKT